MEAIAQALSDIFISGRYADKVIEYYLKKNRKWGSRDRKFFAESVYEVLRWWRFLWWLKGDLEKFSVDVRRDGERNRSGKINGDGAPISSELVVTGGDGVTGDESRYSNDNGDRVPFLDESLPDKKSLTSLWAHWWVWIKERNNNVFSGSQVSPYLTLMEWEKLQVRLKTMSESPPAIAASIPDWLFERGKVELGEELWAKTLKTLNEPALVYLRANTLKISAVALMTRLKGEGIDSQVVTNPLASPGPKMGTEPDLQSNLQDTNLSPKTSNLLMNEHKKNTSPSSSKQGASNPDKLGTESIKSGINKSGTESLETLVLVERKNVFSTKAFQLGFFEVQDWSSQQVAPMLDVAPGMRVIDACAGAGGKTLHLAALMKNKGKILALDIYEWKLKELRTRASRNGVDIIEVKVIEGQKTIKRLESSADRVLLDVPCSGLGVLRRNPDSKWKLSIEEIERLSLLQQEILTSYARMVKVGGKLVYSTCSILPSENERQVLSFLEKNPEFVLIKQKVFMPQDHNSDGFYMAQLERKS